MNHVLALVLLSATTTAAAKEHLEDVHGRVTALAHAALLECLLAASIVDVTLLRITQNLVRLRDELELLGRLGIRILVRMELERHLTIGLFELVWRGVRFNAQEIVVACLFDHFQICLVFLKCFEYTSTVSFVFGFCLVNLKTEHNCALNI